MLVSSLAFAHGGRTDSSGGHKVSGGGYHYHSTSVSSYRPTVAFHKPQNVAPRYAPKTTVRRKPRTSARLSYYVKARAKREDMRVSRSIQTTTDSSLSHEFLFHHVKFNPYKAVSFTDEKTTWRLYTPKRTHIQIAKERIVRIEPVDPKNFRTWIDSTGTYSTVARYETFDEPDLELTKLHGDRIRLDVRRLSLPDKLHVKALVDQQ